MTLTELLLLLAAGVGAGTINTVVGSGSLVSFPALLAAGLPPVLANVTNNLGVLPGNISGAWAYRSQLRSVTEAAKKLLAASAVGGLVGALLLLSLPAAVFDWVVPILVAVACVLVVIGPKLKVWLVSRTVDTDRPAVSGKLRVGVLLTGVYGGYFGAAQGVILLSILSLGVKSSLQAANALKNLLAAAANGAAAIVFVIVSDVHWVAAGMVALGSIIGGQLGGVIGPRIPDLVFRMLVVLVGVIAIWHLVWA